MGITQWVLSNEDPDIRHYQHIYILVVLFGGCLVHPDLRLPRHQHAASALTVSKAGQLVASSFLCCSVTRCCCSYMSPHLTGLDSTY